MSISLTKIQVSREMWRRINREKEDPSQTLDDVLRRVFEDRDRFKKMIMSQGKSVI